MTGRNLAKPFSIAGFFLGEIYMVYSVLAPYRSGADIPTSALIWKLIVSSVFFGPFGAVVGAGVGLLIGGLFIKWR